MSEHEHGGMPSMHVAGGANHYAHWGLQQGEQAANPFGHDAMLQRPYEPMDAVIGELLREVLHMARHVDELRQEIAALRAELRKQPNVVAFPGNALRHSPDGRAPR